MSVSPTDKRPISSDYLIIGGGVAGCALTYALAKRGSSVTLVERGEIGRCGASSVPVALLNPYRGRSARANGLDLAGLAAVERLMGELSALGLEHGVHLNGVLRVASNKKQAKTWRKREGVRWLEPEEVGKVYHAPFGGFLVERGGWLEPLKFLRALVNAAERNGAVVLGHHPVQHHPVKAVRPNGAWQEVETSKGTLSAKTVIYCVGANAEVEAHLGVGLAHVAGEVIGLETDAHLPHALAGAIYGAQVEGRVHIGGNHRPAGRTDESAPRQLQRSASWFIPALEEAELSAVWTGVRAKAENNMPVIQEVREGVWFFGALAGRGFLCAAHLAEGLAERLERGVRSEN